jgi:hypothetical protein
MVSQAEGKILACYSICHRSPDLNGFFDMACAMENRCKIGICNVSSLQSASSLKRVAGKSAECKLQLGETRVV